MAEKDLMNNEWYFQSLGREQLEDLLKSCIIDCFGVRPSSSPGSFVLVTYSEDSHEVVNTLIQKERYTDKGKTIDGYRLQGARKPQKTIAQVILHTPRLATFSGSVARMVLNGANPKQLRDRGYVGYSPKPLNPSPPPPSSSSQQQPSSFGQENGDQDSASKLQAWDSLNNNPVSAAPPPNPSYNPTTFSSVSSPPSASASGSSFGSPAKSPAPQPSASQLPPVATLVNRMRGATTRSSVNQIVRVYFQDDDKSFKTLPFQSEDTVLDLAKLMLIKNRPTGTFSELSPAEIDKNVQEIKIYEKTPQNTSGLALAKLAEVGGIISRWRTQGYTEVSDDRFRLVIDLSTIAPASKPPTPTSSSPPSSQSFLSSFEQGTGGNTSGGSSNEVSSFQAGPSKYGPIPDDVFAPSTTTTTMHQPVHPVQPIQPVQPVQASQPVQPVQAIQPVQSSPQQPPQDTSQQGLQSQPSPTKYGAIPPPPGWVAQNSEAIGNTTDSSTGTKYGFVPTIEEILQQKQREQQSSHQVQSTVNTQVSSQASQDPSTMPPRGPSKYGAIPAPPQVPLHHFQTLQKSESPSQQSQQPQQQFHPSKQQFQPSQQQFQPSQQQQPQSQQFSDYSRLPRGTFNQSPAQSGDMYGKTTLPLDSQPEVASADMYGKTTLPLHQQTGPGLLRTDTYGKMALPSQQQQTNTTSQGADTYGKVGMQQQQPF